MIYKGTQISFPAVSKVSFFKLLKNLEQTGQKDGAVAQLLSECERFPELVSGIEQQDFEKDNEIIGKLCSTLFPEALQNNEIKGIIPPFEFRPFYASKRLKKILADSYTDFSIELNDFNEDQLYIYGCASILTFYYNYPFLMTLPIVVNIPVKETGLTKTYRVVMNGDLLEIEPSSTACDICDKDYHELISDFNNIALWKQKFPPGSWIFKGIGIISLFDITQDQAISNITSRLLVHSLHNLNEILIDFKLFLGVEDLTMGFLSHDKSGFNRDVSGLGNIVLQQNNTLNFKDNLCANSYQKLIINGEPIVITDVSQWNTTDSCSIISTIIEDLSIGSYILLPLRHHNQPLGYLELASQKSFALNGATLLKLNLLLPTLGMAISRNRTELKNRQEAIIQQKFTAIHPSVKWRFEEEAFQYIEQNESESSAPFNDILFPNVFALYGQFDVRGSSNKRNEAVKADLLTQLIVVLSILEKVWQQCESPIYEEQMFRIKSSIADLEQQFFTGSEHAIMNFLQAEVHPLFNQLIKESNHLKCEIQGYFSQLHPELNTIYDLRKNYDNSISILNQSLSGLLDKKQKKAQQMFPHYFERYKTDGIEYNMYIGQSITNQKEFSPLNLQNLQLWQLLTTCEIEKSFVDINQRLKVPLDITSLILVYSMPLSVHFRVDEKRFDVAGAYNARYEMVKKRIDKANIKGTNERLTCPGKIAIIYSNPDDAVVYERYISFMENKGYLIKGSTEYVEVEDLPGINGLMALRVKINHQENN